MKRILIATTIMLSASACAHSNHNRIAAVVNGEKITQSIILKAYSTLPEPLRKGEPLKKVYPALLNSMIINTLLVQEAKKADIAHDQTYQEQLKNLQNALLIQTYLSKKIQPYITDSVLHKEYNVLITKMPVIQEAHILMIIKPTKKEANLVIKKLISGTSFQSLMRSGQSKDLGYIAQNQVSPYLSKIIFSLQKGQFTFKPIEENGTFHILKIVDKRVKQKPTFQELKPRLISILNEKLTQDLIKQLSDNAKITRFDLDGKLIKIKKNTHKN